MPTPASRKAGLGHTPATRISASCYSWKTASLHQPEVVRAKLYSMRSILGCTSLLLLVSVDAQEFHTSPYCWNGARTYASGELERVEVAVDHIEATEAVKGSESPNGAYRFVVTGRPQESDPDWYPRLIIFNERPYFLQVKFPKTKSISKAEWINENLIYVRLWWGQVAGTDIIVDVERETVVYQQPIRYGEIAFQQYKQCAADNLEDEAQCECLKSSGEATKDSTPTQGQ
jgi:hypothetical protein